MKKIFKPILYYIGLISGTIIVLYNYDILLSIYNISYSNVQTFYVVTILKRLIELLIVGGVCKILQNNISGVILLILTGGITGGCISYKTVKIINADSILINSVINSNVTKKLLSNENLTGVSSGYNSEENNLGLFGTGILDIFLYSMIIAVIILLYYIVIKIFISENGYYKSRDLKKNIENVYSTLNKSIGGYVVIITIILINIFLEVKILKFF